MLDDDVDRGGALWGGCGVWVVGLVGGGWWGGDGALNFGQLFARVGGDNDMNDDTQMLTYTKGCAQLILHLLHQSTTAPPTLHHR